MPLCKQILQAQGLQTISPSFARGYVSFVFMPYIIKHTLAIGTGTPGIAYWQADSVVSESLNQCAGFTIASTDISRTSHTCVANSI